MPETEDKDDNAAPGEMPDTETMKGLEGAAATCARSGVFALLMSLAIVSLIPAWTPNPDKAAFSKYALARLVLAEHIVQLDTSPYWRCYLEHKPLAESEPVEELLDAAVWLPCDRRKPTDFVASLDETIRASHAFIVAHGPPQRPSAPTGLRMGPYLVPDIERIYRQLSILDDDELLNRSRQVSAYHDFTIYRWMLRRDALFMSHQGRAPGKKKILRNDRLYLESLPLSDIRVLSELEVPQLANSSKLVGENEPAEISVTPGSLPKDRNLATTMAIVLLLSSVVYFAVFANEAMHCKGFPGPGTIFSAFARSRISMLCFLCAAIAPGLGSARLAMLTTGWLLWVLSAAIWATTLLVIGQLYIAIRSAPRAKCKRHTAA